MPQKKTPASEFCEKMDAWAALAIKGGHLNADAWKTVRFAISKSCLLDRMIYGGESPSTTPCPVHKGTWAGIHFGWPGQKWSDGTPCKVSEQCQKWYDAGCRCFLHSCGCTTGWQP